MLNKPDFALQWLNYLGNSIYNKGQQILQYDGKNPSYPIKPLGTKIKVGQELGDESDEGEYIYMSFHEFERMGYAIKADTSVKWMHGQRVAYRIIKKTKNSFGISYDAFKKSGIKVEHDTSNRRLRIVGKNVIASLKLRVDSGVADWIVYDDSSPKKPIPRKKKPLTKDDMKLLLKGKRFGGVSDDFVEFIDIKDIPMIVSDERYIVCLQKDIICPRILITGKSRKGKSLFGNGLVHRIFYLWGDRVGWLIDPQKSNSIV